MILLDTNVVSEVMRATPAQAVLEWANEQESSALYVASITIGEIAYGLHILPDGTRRYGLNERFERFIALAFAQRVLAYDEPAARVYGEVMGARKELGRPISVPDGQIAAIALTLTKSDPVMLKIIDPPTARMFAGVGTGMLVVVCGDARSTRRGVAASQQIVTQAGFEGFF